MVTTMVSERMKASMAETYEETLSLLAHTWFSGAAHCINKSAVLSRPNMAALQAICILPMVSRSTL